MRHLVVGALVVAACVAMARAAVAQNASRPIDVFDRNLFYEKEVRDRMEAATLPKQNTMFQYGGFYFPSYLQTTDTADGNIHVSRQDLRLWGQLDIDEVHKVFARMKMSYTDFASGDAGPLGRGHDLDGPDVDVAYYELDLARAMQKYGGQTWPAVVKIRGGRQFITLGRGLVMADTLDAGSFDFGTKDFFFTGFAGVTPDGRQDIDFSTPNNSHSHRHFYGLEADYKGIPGHTPYYYMVIQNGGPDLDGVNVAQDYTYHSNYHGIGLKGSLAPDLKYGVEHVWEFGHGSPDAVKGEDERIDANAFDAELDYYIHAPCKPQAQIEYAYASGDKDRRSAMTALGGNRAGTSDEAFQGFSYVNSGLALMSRFSNLQFVRLGSRFTPYDKKEGLGRIDVGFNHYFQFKASPDGPIDDFRANRDASSIGQETDVFLEWKILSDLALTVHYGHFWPGAAYEERHGRNFLFTALTISF